VTFRVSNTKGKKYPEPKSRGGGGEGGGGEEEELPVLAIWSLHQGIGVDVGGRGKARNAPEYDQSMTTELSPSVRTCSSSGGRVGIQGQSAGWKDNPAVDEGRVHAGQRMRAAGARVEGAEIGRWQGRVKIKSEPHPAFGEGDLRDAVVVHTVGLERRHERVGSQVPDGARDPA